MPRTDPTEWARCAYRGCAMRFRTTTPMVLCNEHADEIEIVRPHKPKPAPRRAPTPDTGLINRLAAMGIDVA